MNQEGGRQIEKLFDASRNGDAETVRLILESGADVHAKYDLALREASFAQGF